MPALPPQWRAALVCGLTLAVAAIGVAGAADMYRWTDSEGNVHYGDNPPPSREAERVQPEGSIVETPSGASGEQGQGTSDRTKQQGGEGAKNKGGGQSGQEKKLSAKECDKARERLKLMKARPGGVLIRKEDGSVDRLTEKQRQKRMDQLKKLLKKHCE